VKQISAWIRDPANNWIKGMSKHAALYRLFCENPEACDLFVRENTCLNCGVMSSCKFGRKIGTEGPTRQARSFYTTVQKWKEENAEYISKLNSLTAYNRIFRTNGYFYLPYAFMTGSFGSGCPLDSNEMGSGSRTDDGASVQDLRRPSPGNVWWRYQ